MGAYAVILRERDGLVEILLSRLAPRVSRTELWTLDGWLHWFQPEERIWYWWDEVARDDHTGVIRVIVRDWPYPYGSLRWLARACGATSLEEEE